MREMFAVAQEGLEQSARTAVQTSAPTASEQAALADSASKIARAKADLAASRLAQAKADAAMPGLDAVAKAKADEKVLAINAEASTSAIEAAEKQYTTSVASQKAAEEGAVNAAVLREARARLFWVGTFGLTLVTAVGTIIGALWVLAVAADDHLRPEGASDRASRGLGNLLALMAISTVCMIGIWVITNEVIQWTIFRGVRQFPIFSMHSLLIFDDSITQYMFGGYDSKTGPGRFLPGGLSLIEAGSAAIVVAVIVLGAAVAATLYQQPEQAITRRAGNATNQVLRLRVTPDVSSSDDVLAYNRFLSRCFERLNVCIYMGATLLVLCVVHVSAQYSWVAALFDPAAQSEPFKTLLPTAFQTLAGEFAFEYGIIFTALLTSLFLPTWLVLRGRAWEAARAQNAGETAETELQKWLDYHGMSFRPFQQYGQILTLLAPTGAATFVTFMKAFTGG